MDFGFSEEQEQLTETVRDFLRSEAPPTYARTMMDDERGYTERVWDAMAGLGWMGLTVPERFGGSELGLLELVLVLEAMGTVVLPGPYFSTMALGLPTLLATANEEQLAGILPAVAEGRQRVTLAVAETRGLWEADGIDMVAERSGDGFVLAGEKLFVPDARSADVIVVVARLDQGLGFFALSAQADGLTVEPMSTVDQTRKLDSVRLDGVAVVEEALLGGAAREPEHLEEILDVARIALSAEACGCAEQSLALSVDYVGVREQFGRPIGSFQAIQHKCADMKVNLENAKSLVYYAAWAMDEDAEDRSLAAAMAKAYASEACSSVVAEAVQVHGGIGFTWDHDLHLYFKRVKADAATYGDATANRERVATLLSL